MARKRKTKQQRRLWRKQRRALQAEAGNQSLQAMDRDSEITLLAAEGQPKDGELRKFKMVAYKGGRLFVNNFYYPVVVDLTGIKNRKKKYPALLQHDSGKRVGHLTQVTVEAGRITAEGVFSGANEHAREVLAQSENGFPWQASLGLRMDRETLEFIAKGDKVEVNGRRFSGPVYVVRASVLNEISFVPIGADEDGATARVAASGQQEGELEMGFDAWLKAQGWDKESLSEAQLSTLQAAYDAQNGESGDDGTGAEPAAGTQTVQASAAGTQTVQAGTGGAEGMTLEAQLAEERQQRAAEVERVRRIREICAEHNDPVMRINSQDVVLEAHAISEGWDATRVELECLRQSRGSASVQAHSHGTACTLEAMQGAVMLASGIPLDWNGFGTMEAQHMGLPSWTARGINDDRRQQIMEAAHRFSEMSSLDICREAVRLDGRMIPTGRQELIQAAFSGSNLSNIWTTNVNARLLMKFRETPDSTRGWCQERDVADFRLNDSIRVEKGGTLTKHARGGSAEHHSGDDTKESYRIARYSKQFFRDEMDVIDDRLMAGQDVIDEMAKAASRLRPDLVYAILLGNPNMADGTPLFDATRNNLDDTSADLSETTLKEAITRMWLMQENGVNLNLTPTHLVTAATLNFTAKQILRSAETRAASGTGGPTMNALQNAVANLVSDSRIDNGVVDPDSGTTIAGDSTASFLISNQGPTIEVGYLRGTGRVPSVTTWKKAGEDGVWGIGASVKMDVGAKAMAYQTMQKFTN